MTLEEAAIFFKTGKLWGIFFVCQKLKDPFFLNITSYVMLCYVMLIDN